MKFGKSLLQVIDSSSPSWSEYWINYKGLKKSVKELTKHDAGNTGDKQAGKNGDSAPKPVTDPNSIAMSPQEVVFFKALRAELLKVSNFFSREEAILAQQVEDFLSEYETKAEGDEPDDARQTRLMAKCVDHYKQLLLLENYAVMNYCGFSKILKKHDRWTGYGTREKYMTRMVNHQSFTVYPRLRALIQKIETVFEQSSSSSSSKDMRSSSATVRDPSEQTRASPSEPRQLTLDALQRLHDNSKSIQKDEIDITSKRPPLAEDGSIPPGQPTSPNDNGGGGTQAPRLNLKRKRDDNESDVYPSSPVSYSNSPKPRSPRISLRSILN